MKINEMTYADLCAAVALEIIGDDGGGVGEYLTEPSGDPKLELYEAETNMFDVIYLMYTLGYGLFESVLVDNGAKSHSITYIKIDDPDISPYYKEDEFPKKRLRAVLEVALRAVRREGND